MTDARTADIHVTRKLVHIVFGGCALLLKWLSPWQAAAMALAAFLFNLFILPLVGGKRISRGDRGYDLGILLYPLAVLALILAFPRHPAIAGVVWVILAAGDGFATLVGANIRSPRIPWNPDKSILGSVAFVVASFLPAWAIAEFLGLESRLLGSGAIVALTVLICALVESLPLHVDDNITVPIAGALAMVVMTRMSRIPDLTLSSAEVIWLVVNAALALLGYFARTVTVSGMIGGWVLGTILILFAGWPMYIVLLTFFIIGSLSTKAGYREKARLNIAQESGGRRGVSHAFANVGVAAMLSIMIATAAGDPTVLWVAAVASLATAAADTAASELGPLIGRRAFLPITLRPVPPGTEGAISLEGTVAGAVAAFLVSFIGVSMLAVRTAGRHGGLNLSSWNWPAIWHAVAVSTVAAILASYIESITGSWNRKRARRVPSGALNFFNTLVGAVIVLLIFAARGMQHGAR